MTSTGALRLLVADAAGRPWRGDLGVRIHNDLERVVYDDYKAYEHPVVFQGLMRTPRGRHRIHLRTKSYVPMTLLVNLERSEESQPARLLLDDRVADKNGHRIPFPSFDELEQSSSTDIAQLSDEVDPAIQASSDFPVRSVKWEEFYDRLVRKRNVHENHRRLACLFNLHRKMKATLIDVGPGSGAMTAWSFVHSIFRIEQDRLYAQVRPDLITPELLQGLEKSAILAPHDSSSHNVLQPPQFTKHAKTFKSEHQDRVAILQLTFSSRVVGGTTVWCLDADIDEKTGLGHVVGEGIYHWITRTKTNPYAVHQLLASRGLEPAYPLLVM